MNPAVVFGFIPIAVLLSASPVTATYNLDGTWYVVAQDKSSPLNWKCWTANITQHGGVSGKGVTNFVNSIGESVSASFQFFNYATTEFRAIIGVESTRGSGSMYLNFLDSNTVRLYNLGNTLKLRKLQFENIYAQRNTSIPLPSDISAKMIDSCEVYEGNVY